MKEWIIMKEKKEKIKQVWGAKGKCEIMGRNSKN